VRSRFFSTISVTVAGDFFIPDGPRLMLIHTNGFGFVTVMVCVIIAVIIVAVGVVILLKGKKE